MQDRDDKVTLAVFLMLCVSVVAMVYFAIQSNDANISGLVKQGNQSERCFEDELYVLTYEPKQDSVSWVCVPWDNLFPRN